MTVGRYSYNISISDVHRAVVKVMMECECVMMVYVMMVCVMMVCDDGV